MYQEEHRIFRQSFRRFAEQELTPYTGEWERDGIIPREIWRKMGDAGFLCPWLPEEYGGSGADFLYSMIIAEELARAGAVSLLTPLHGDIIVPYLYQLGTEEQKRRWLPGCASGEIITSIAMTEPGAGSDLAGLKTRAERDGDHYVVNGTKTFISNGIQSDLVITAVRTDRGAKDSKGISLLAIERGAPGFKRGRKLQKLGMHAQDTAELTFEDCRVPASNLLGEEGKGFYYLMEHLQQERLVAVIECQALAECMLEMTIQYAKDRKAFGAPISRFQHNAFKMVEMATEIRLGRVFLEDLVDKHMRGEGVVSGVSMAQAWTCEMAKRVAYHCLQLHGGYGYMEEYPISRLYRDVRPYTIFGGTTEIMKLIVARNMGLL
ncbi:MAG: acyl-CoA dehydrogenase family protein [Deltaproteobacteria bacterium]|nr:acyl-CoA dehydrogenase family protein [Deltaproteobacteria bacterium]